MTSENMDPACIGFANCFNPMRLFGGCFSGCWFCIMVQPDATMCAVPSRVKLLKKVQLFPFVHCGAASCKSLKIGLIFRCVTHSGAVWGSGISEKVVWWVVRQCAKKAAIDRVAPHDLRRTCARLCHSAGGELEQIQFLLGTSVCGDHRKIPWLPTEDRARGQRQAGHRAGFRGRLPVSRSTTCTRPASPSTLHSASLFAEPIRGRGNANPARGQPPTQPRNLPCILRTEIERLRVQPLYLCEADRWT
jgi:hypothetical protein